jgi:WD40 repeat protein
LLGPFVFSADGKFLAAQAAESEKADPHILCWNVEKGEKLWRVSSKDCGSFAFTPDGRTLIAAPDRSRAPRESRDSPPWRAWDAATGKPAVGWKFPKQRVATNPNYAAVNFAIAPDNRTLVFVPFSESGDREGLNGSVRLWDLRTGRSLHTLTIPGRDGWFPAMRIGPFFPDGKSFLTNNDLLRRWESASGRPLWPENEKLGHWADVIGMAYSPDGRRLATAAHDCTVRLWDVATAKPLHVLRLRTRNAGYLTFTPDGKQLLSGPECGEVYVWDVEAGKEVQHLKLTDPGGIIGDSCHKMRLSTDGRTIIEAGRGSSVADKNKYVGILARWDLASGKRKSRLELEERLRLEDFSPDGQLILAHDEKSDATELFDTTTGMSQVKLEGNPGHRYAFSADGRHVAAVVMKPSTKFPWKLLVSEFTGHTDWDTGDYEIVVWETKTGRALRHISIPIGCDGSLALSPDGCYLADAGMRDIRIWDFSTGKVVLKYKRQEPRLSGYTDPFASCLTFAPDGRTLATGHYDSTVLIWNAAPPKH